MGDGTGNKEGTKPQEASKRVKLNNSTFPIVIIIFLTLMMIAISIVVTVFVLQLHSPKLAIGNGTPIEYGVGTLTIFFTAMLVTRWTTREKQNDVDETRRQLLDSAAEISDIRAGSTTVRNAALASMARNLTSMEADDLRLLLQTFRAKAFLPPTVDTDPASSADESEQAITQTPPDIAVRPTPIDVGAQADAILIQMYAHGLSQARRSFTLSAWFGAIGSAILLAGVSLAIFDAPTTGQKYAAIVASTASIVTNALALVFFRQSNQARKDMTAQSAELLKDARERRAQAVADAHFETSHRIALELVEKISDLALQDQKRAEMALLLAGAPATSQTRQAKSKA